MIHPHLNLINPYFIPYYVEEHFAEIVPKTTTTSLYSAFNRAFSHCHTQLDRLIH